jgi:hypothetical protein
MMMKSLLHGKEIKSGKVIKSFQLSRLVCASLLICSALHVIGYAQATTPPPPPLGPATYRSDQKQIGVGVITSIVRGKTTEIVNNVNKNLKDNGHGNISVSLMSLRVNKPMRVATEYTNRQNEWFVKIPMNVGLEIHIPYSSNRQVYIPLDINLSCKDWHTGRGVVRVTGRPGPISIEGGNIIEDVLTVKTYVDNQVKSNFPPLTPFTATIGDQPCATIGVSPGEPPDYRFGFVAYDPPRIRPIDDVRLGPTVEVTFVKLKRLSARGRSGDVLYQPTENIVLEAYANHTSRQSSTMTMSEGDEVNLTFPPFVVKSPGELLVVLANINQQPLAQPQDSAFNAWPGTMNFSPGTHTLQITKLYTMPPRPPIRKPTFVRAPAYECALHGGPRHPL